MHNIHTIVNFAELLLTCDIISTYIYLSCSYDPQYDDPADVIHDEDVSIRKQKHTDSPKVRLRAEQEMNLYSEPVKRTKKKRRPPSDDESEVNAARANINTCVSQCVCVGGGGDCWMEEGGNLGEFFIY